MQSIFINIALLASLIAHQVPVVPPPVQPTKSPGQVEGQRQGRPGLTKGRNSIGLISKSLLAQPFTRLWQYLTDAAVAIPPALDSRRVYLALAGGRVVCLDRETGSLLWSSEPGGVISGAFALGEEVLYIASHRVGEDRSEAGASLRALDRETGLTLWVRDYERPFTSPLVLLRNRIYAGSADGPVMRSLRRTEMSFGRSRLRMSFEVALWRPSG